MRIPQQNSPGVDGAFVEQYTNKLDKFRTYSYYHIVCVCNSQHTRNMLGVFEDPDIIKQVFAQPTPKNEMGYRLASFVPGKQGLENSFYILCNGLTDVDIVVSTIATDMTVALPRIQIGSKSLTGITGSVEIREPQGVKLLNMVREILNELKITAQSMQLIIKTVFVGVTHSDTTEWVVDTPPIYGTITGFDIAVDEQGSVYNIPFLGNVGGTGLDPALTSSASGQLLRGNGSLKNALETLADSYTQDATNNLARLPENVAVGKQSVRYVIKIHPDIEAKLAGWTTTQDRNARQATSNSGQPLVVPTNVSLDGAIEYIFEACADYLRQATSGDIDAFLYKVVSIKEESPAGPVLWYQINPFYLNKPVAAHNRLKAAKDPVMELLAGDNVVVYDYTFTGKNTDIESFAMKIDEGLAYFQTITEMHTTSDNVKDGNYQTAGSVQSPNAAAAPDGAPTDGKHGAVGPATNSNEQQFASQSLTALKEQYNVVYDRTWSRGAAKVACVLHTRGHTGWLGLFSINPYKLVDGKQSLLLGDIPAVYINILMPTPLSLVTNGRDSPMEFESFWFRGLWRVLNVKNTFSEGVFSTELELIIIQSDPITAKSKKDPTTSESPTIQSNVKLEEPSTPAPPPTKAPPFMSNSTNGKPNIATATNDIKLTKDFSLGNMTVTKVNVPSNRPANQNELDNLTNLAEVLQYIKDQLKIPITINSAYRSEAVNRAVGGASNSDHKIGQAVDFTSSAMTPKQIVDAIRGLNLPYKQLILEIPAKADGTPKGSGWVHLSVSRSPAQNTKKTLVWKGALSNNKYLPYTGTA